MRAIGIRELRQQASRYLRDVEGGETIEVTDRGRPVALLTPVPPGSAVERLVASGRLVGPTADLLDLGAPLPPSLGGASLRSLDAIHLAAAMTLGGTVSATS